MTNHTALQSLLNSRYSCRKFRADPVPRDIIEQILTDAGRVPSWCNAQPWHITLTSGAATKAFGDAMTKAAFAETPSCDIPFPKTYTGVRQDRRRTCGHQLYDAVGIERKDTKARAAQMAENYRFFGAPHVAVITTAKELETYGALDCGGFITAFCLSAQAQGIATIPQGAIAFYSDTVRQHFNIPEDQLVLAAISFGYAEETHPINGFRTDRAPLGQFVNWRDS